MSRISIYTLNLFDWSGGQLITGGMERYIRDLSFLVRDLGYQVDIHQNGSSDFVQSLDGIPVFGYGVAGRDQMEAVRQMDMRSSDKVLYGWIGQQNWYKPNSISICHGVWWDDKESSDENRVQAVRDYTIKPSLAGSTVVSVDANYINVCRALSPNSVKDMVCIPNYVDTSIFKPKEKKVNDKVTILYPRRIDRVRGIYEMRELANNILPRYPQVEFMFAIDQNHPHLYQEFTDWANNHPYKERIKYRTFAFDEMPEAYQQADIVVIPTMASEGTSLSCLEAMGSGCAIVSTNIGGLSNLILDGFNGYLTNPNVDDLERAIVKLIENPDLRETFGKNALATSEAFSKRRWEEKWTEVIYRVYGRP